MRFDNPLLVCYTRFNAFLLVIPYTVWAGRGGCFVANGSVGAFACPPDPWYNGTVTLDSSLRGDDLRRFMSYRRLFSVSKEPGILVRAPA